MNILLVQPHFKKREKAYPLGLGYIGAALKQKGHRVVGVDLSFTSLADVCCMIEAEGIELIGISLLSYSFKNALSFCQGVKSYKSVPIVAGGPHATVFKERLLCDYSDCFDYLIVGEGDNSFLELVASLEKGVSLRNVGSLIYKDNGRIATNERSAEENNLDSLPFPDRSLFPVFKYKGMFARYGDYTQIITSRGCNNRCKHCPQPLLWQKWRGRSAENIIEEIELIVDIFGIRDFHIEDSNFFGGGTERIRDFCLKLIEKKLNIKWQCPNGIPVADFSDESILELMAQAGCYNICLGIESFDNEMIGTVGRSSDFNKVKKIVRAAHKAGIEIVGYFMIGFPAQTSKSIMDDIYLSRKASFDFVHYSIFDLIPGSSLYRDYSHNLHINDILNRKMSVSKVDIIPLKRIRTIFSLLNCFNPRTMVFIFRSLITARNPFKFIRRAIAYSLDIDIKF